jgi:quercetin dioxygenase-like cupin family protein
MTIQDIKTALETSAHPVGRSLHHNDHFKVIVMGFKKGMILKEHKAHKPTKLTVIEGAVNYIQDDETVALSLYQEHVIPIEITHSVEALEDSLCLLTQG